MDLGPLGVDAGHRDRPRLPRQPDGQVERIGMADRLDRQVHPPAVGELLDLRRGSCSVRCTGVAPNDSAIARRSSTVSIAITSDAPAALAACTAQRPDRAHPEDRRRLALRQRARVDRVEPGPHHVAGEQARRRPRAPRGPGAGSGSRAGRAPARPGPPGASRGSRRARRRGRSRTCGTRRARRRSTRRRRPRRSRAPGRRPRTRVTSSPAAITSPTNSWPITKPGSICTRPW